MFLHVSVILLTGGVSGEPPGPGRPPRTKETPQDQGEPPRTRQTPGTKEKPPDQADPPGPRRTPLPPAGKNTAAYGQ